MKCYLYRHYDGEGRLLYIGISLSTVARLATHMGGSHWAGDIRRVDIEEYPDRKAALKAERDAVEREDPPYNIKLKRKKKIKHKDRTPDKFKARLIALAGSIKKAGKILETDAQTLGRWCNGKSKIPGVAWVALAWWEERT